MIFLNESGRAKEMSWKWEEKKELEVIKKFTYQRNKIS